MTLNLKVIFFDPTGIKESSSKKLQLKEVLFLAKILFYRYQKFLLRYQYSMKPRKSLISLQRKRNIPFRSSQKCAYIKIRQGKQERRRMKTHPEAYSNYKPPLLETQAQYFNRLAEMYPFLDQLSFKNIISQFSKKKLRTCLLKFNHAFNEKRQEEFNKLASIIMSFQDLIELIGKGELIEVETFRWKSEYVSQKAFKSIIKLIKMSNERVFLSQCIDQPKLPQRSIEGDLHKFVDQKVIRSIRSIRESNQFKERIEIQNSRLQRNIQTLEIQYQDYREDSASFNRASADFSLRQSNGLYNQMWRLNEKLQDIKNGSLVWEISRQVLYKELKDNQQYINALKYQLELQRQQLSENVREPQILRQPLRERESLVSFIASVGQNTDKDLDQLHSSIQPQQRENIDQHPELQVNMQKQGLTHPNHVFEKTYQRIEEEVYVNTVSGLNQHPPLICSALEYSNYVEKVQQEQHQQERSSENGNDSLTYSSQNSPLPAQSHLEKKEVFIFPRRLYKFKKCKRYKSFVTQLNRFLKRKYQKFVIKVSQTIHSKKFGQSGKKCLVVQLERYDYISMIDKQKEQQIQIQKLSHHQSINISLQENVPIFNDDQKPNADYQKQIQKCHQEIILRKYMLNLFQQMQDQHYSKQEHHSNRRSIGQKIKLKNLQKLMPFRSRLFFTDSQDHSQDESLGQFLQKISEILTNKESDSQDIFAVFHCLIYQIEVQPTTHKKTVEQISKYLEQIERQDKGSLEKLLNQLERQEKGIILKNIFSHSGYLCRKSQNFMKKIIILTDQIKKYYTKCHKKIIEMLQSLKSSIEEIADLKVKKVALQEKVDNLESENQLYSSLIQQEGMFWIEQKLKMEQYEQSRSPPQEGCQVGQPVSSENLEQDQRNLYRTQNFWDLGIQVYSSSSSEDD